MLPLPRDGANDYRRQISPPAKTFNGRCTTSSSTTFHITKGHANRILSLNSKDLVTYLFALFFGESLYLGDHGGVLMEGYHHCFTWCMAKLIVLIHPWKLIAHALGSLHIMQSLFTRMVVSVVRACVTLHHSVPKFIWPIVKPSTANRPDAAWRSEVCKVMKRRKNYWCPTFPRITRGGVCKHAIQKYLLQA